MMFLDCPAWLDEEGAVRCGLPAKVRHRFITRSTGGPFSGPPSGRTAAITVIGICRVAGGRITKHWAVPDRFALLAIKVMQQWPMTRLTDAAAPARCPARGRPAAPSTRTMTAARTTRVPSGTAQNGPCR
jgi:SnoaL-like polyketide cyclase